MTMTLYIEKSGLGRVPERALQSLNRQLQWESHGGGDGVLDWVAHWQERNPRQLIAP